MKIKIEELEELCFKILLSKNLTKEEAEIIFNEYLDGELKEGSHGFLTFPKIVEKLNQVQGELQIIKEGDNYALIDAQGNIGQLVGKFAMDLAIKKAKVKGIALVGMNNMPSYLMPGYYAKMAAQKNMIGLVIDNARSRVAPYGGIDPKLGTNPLGFSVPTKDVPFVLDMATSVRAMGEVRLAKKLARELPGGVALDKEGNSTNNPADVYVLNSFFSLFIIVHVFIYIYIYI